MRASVHITKQFGCPYSSTHWADDKFLQSMRQRISTVDRFNDSYEVCLDWPIESKCWAKIKTCFKWTFLVLGNTPVNGPLYVRFVAVASLGPINLPSMLGKWQCNLQKKQSKSKFGFFQLQNSHGWTTLYLHWLLEKLCSSKRTCQIKLYRILVFIKKTI